MPAIQLARLKHQTVELAEKYSDPKAFVRGVHELMEYYADRAFRPGLAGEPQPLLPAYHVPKPVLRQVILELSPFIDSDRQSILILAEALWREAQLECKLLAASILGSVPPEPPEEILERVGRWVTSGLDDRVLDALIKEGMIRLLDEKPEAYLQQIENWLTAGGVLESRLGLKGLFSLLHARGFENLPFLFRLLGPIVREAPFKLRDDLLDVFGLLAKRYPNETSFFLRESLKVQSENPGTGWVIRNSLRSFPSENQASLRAALRENF
jgi:hypothetical protein